MAAIELGHSARVVIVLLEQVAHKSGHSLIAPVARELKRCETVVKSDVISGLTELVARASQRRACRAAGTHRLPVLHNRSTASTVSRRADTHGSATACAS